MSAVDWDEVKRLAADFQKAQLSSTLQKLSENNCIEIITKLIEANLLDVIFTVDGKEYITPQHLQKEIKDELYSHNGRINLVELAKILNVDHTHVAKIAADIEKHENGIKIILGQLIDRSYMNKILGEINDKLTLAGYINITELTLHYDLPSEFLQSLIERALGKTVHGRQDQQDPRIIYTEAFIARNKAKLRGALSAITKPTSLSAIHRLCNMPETLLDNLHATMQLPGVITGKQLNNGMYVPAIYSKSQSEWVDNFYKQNGYIEYDALTRLGIADTKNYIKRHFQHDEMILLDTVAVGQSVIDQVDANVEEIIATNSFADIYPLLPSVFAPEDVETLLKDALKRSKIHFHIFATTAIVSDVFLQELSKSFEEIAATKAKEAVESGKWLQHVAESKIKLSSTNKQIDNNKIDKKDDRRRKAASGKAGGGSQGRETKTKSTKKKYNQGKHYDYDSDDDKQSKSSEKSEFVLFTSDELKKKLSKDDNLTEIEDLVEQLTDYLQPKLNKLALSMAEQLAQSSKTNNLNEIEERLNMIISNIKIFERGIKCIQNKETVISLSKYLMKTLGVDFINDLIKLAAQQNITQCSNNITIETRQKMINELPNDVRDPLFNVNQAIAKGLLDEFLNDVDSAMAACCLVLKKFDKKREKAMVLGHRQALIEQLNTTQDPALGLHLITSILFTATTQCALHMSGRHVSSVLAFLQPHLIQSTATMLSQYHNSVLELLNANDESTKTEAQKLLENGLKQLQEISNNFKDHIKDDKSHK
ncbi:hypothetical protein PV326_012334 [Microctonus aethiopoides]|nr:hypothetical protein PV326_012334 [Microctonus aethiopoides]